MPGRATPLVNEQYYHIFNRGNNKQIIFSSERSYTRFLKLIQFYQYSETPVSYSTFIRLKKDRQELIWLRMIQSPKQVEVLCYCLMPNHFHFLLKQKLDNGISCFMSNIQNSYTKYINVKSKRHGHLFQGKFNSVRIEDDEQLLHVGRYIHLNPYTGIVVKTLEQLLGYPWSSLDDYLNPIKSSFINKDVILNFFKKKNYQDFIFDQADYQRTLNKIKHLILEDYDNYQRFKYKTTSKVKQKVKQRYKIT